MLLAVTCSYLPLLSVTCSYLQLLAFTDIPTQFNKIFIYFFVNS